MARKTNEELKAEIEELSYKLEVAEASLAVRTEDYGNLREQYIKLKEEFHAFERKTEYEIKILHEMLDAVIDDRAGVHIGLDDYLSSKGRPKYVPSLASRLAYLIKVVSFPQTVYIEGDRYSEDN